MSDPDAGKLESLHDLIKKKLHALPYVQHMELALLKTLNYENNGVSY